VTPAAAERLFPTRSAKSAKYAPAVIIMPDKRTSGTQLARAWLQEFDVSFAASSPRSPEQFRQLGAFPPSEEQRCVAYFVQ
jgi:hypothetical protein